MPDTHTRRAHGLDGECAANACLEWANETEHDYRALNLMNRTEANLLLEGLATSIATGVRARTGSCGSQSRACTREQKLVCADPPGRAAARTMENVCLAKGLLYDALGDELGAPATLHAPAGACAN